MNDKSVLTSWEECRGKEITFLTLLSIACLAIIISPFYRSWRITSLRIIEVTLMRIYSNVLKNKQIIL